MRTFSVIFNGHDLTDHLRVTTLSRGINLGRTSLLENKHNRKHMKFMGHTSTLATIEMGFTLQYDVNDKRNILAEILNVTEPKELYFSDEPERVYYAFPTGDISVTERAFLGSGTIVWEIPDGVAYSQNEYEFRNLDSSSGTLQKQIAVYNPGTEPMELEMEATFSSDNGFFGVQDESGSVRALFGDMTEVDGTPYEQSEKLFDEHFQLNQGWALNSGKVPPVTPNPRQVGTVSYNIEKEGDGFVKPINYGPVVNDWSGPSLTKTIPPDSEGKYPLNWGSAFRWDFNTVGAGTAGPAQVGHQSMTFVDQNNEIIVSIVVEDNYGYAEKSDFAVYIRNKRVYDSRKLDIQEDKRFYVTARPGEGNHIAIEKHADHILIRLPVHNPGFSAWDYIWLPFEETGVELRKVTWYAARYKGHDPITNNLLRAMNVVKWNVQKWEDIPNKFMAGDVLAYGKNDRNIYCTVDGFNELRLRDVGSTLITVPPGISTLHLAYSDFANPPQVTLKGRARYII